MSIQDEGAYIKKVPISFNLIFPWQYKGLLQGEAVMLYNE
jgi:hypothetical protein